MADYNLKVGDTYVVERALRTQTWSSNVLSAATDTTVASATIHVLQADRDTEGLVGSATAATVVDAARAEANDFWKGCMVEFTSGACEGEARVVSGFVSATGTFTLDINADPLPEAPAAGDTFVLRGYPLVPLMDLDTHDHGEVTSNLVRFQVRPDDGDTYPNGVTATPGSKLLVFAVTWAYGAYTVTESYRYSIGVSATA